MRFDELELEDSLLQGLDSMNFQETTPIQELTIPVILEGKDLIACAQTGTGKTAAYTLPILNRLIKEENQSDTVKSHLLYLYYLFLMLSFSCFKCSDRRKLHIDLSSCQSLLFVAKLKKKSFYSHSLVESFNSEMDEDLNMIFFLLIRRCRLRSCMEYC